MNLFYFNYSHELALANDRQNYFPPAHVRVMERDLMPLAAWVAGKEDAVAVESGQVGLCCDFFRRMGLDVCRFVPADALPSGCLPRPWGLDRHVVWQMRKGGADGLPGEEEIEDVRALSSRRLAVDLLAEVRRHLSDAPLCGESVYCQSEGEASRAVARYGCSVLKAPLSGSGRGLRFADTQLQPPITGWVSNTLKAQGGMVVEPFFADKVRDLACEFLAEADGTVRFLGLSLFYISDRCSYEGNLLASQERMRQILFQGEHGYSETAFGRVVEVLRIALQQRLAGHYVGPLGVDMMLVRQTDGTLCLHPCVEVNLRHTMGHVALHLSRRLPENAEARFRIVFSGTPGVLHQTWEKRSPTLKITSGTWEKLNGVWEEPNGISSARDKNPSAENGFSPFPSLLLTPLAPDTQYVALMESQL